MRLRVNHDASASLLSLFDHREQLFSFDRLCDQQPSVCLYQHELHHVDLLVGDPGLVESFQVLCKLFHDVINCDVDGFVDDALVKIADCVLYLSEVLEQLGTRIKYLIGKNVLFSVDPKVRKPFLGRVQDLGQVAQTALLVQDFVGFAELVSETAVRRIRLKHFTQAFDLV